MRKIPVVEIFGPTIQGEGAMIGIQTYFLRTGGCDSACNMCDSKQAVTAELVNKVPRMTGADISNAILSQMETTNVQWITFSGGNPCIWDDLKSTALNLKMHYKKIALETQGTIVPDWLLYCDQITVSPKGPGMEDKCNLDELDFFMHNALKNKDKVCLKIVIFPGLDESYKLDLDFAEAISLRYPKVPLYLSQGNYLIDDSDNNYVRLRLLESFPQFLEACYNRPTLRLAKVLPQLHVWLWGNLKEV